MLHPVALGALSRNCLAANGLDEADGFPTPLLRPFPPVADVRRGLVGVIGVPVDSWLRAFGILDYPRKQLKFGQPCDFGAASHWAAVYISFPSEPFPSHEPWSPRPTSPRNLRTCAGWAADAVAWIFCGYSVAWISLCLRLAYAGLPVCVTLPSRVSGLGLFRVWALSCGASEGLGSCGSSLFHLNSVLP